MKIEYLEQGLAFGLLLGFVNKFSNTAMLFSLVLSMATSTVRQQSQSGYNELCGLQSQK